MNRLIELPIYEENYPMHKLYKLAALCLPLIFFQGKLIGQTISLPTTVKAAQLTSHARLDLALVKASKPDAKREDVEQALDNIFTVAGLDPNLASAFSVRSRIVAAELAYHKHKHPGIGEDNLVSALNNISHHWQLPKHTRTSGNEVRKLRVSMLAVLPGFMLSDLPERLKAHPEKHEMVRSEMSPVEATLTFALLVHQKLTSPEYQMTPAEYNTMWVARHSGQTEPAQRDRRNETHTAIRAAAASGSLRDLLAQADNT